MTVYYPANTLVLLPIRYSLARSLLLVAIKEQVALHSSYRINLLATQLILVKKSLSTPPAPVERSDW